MSDVVCAGNRHQRLAGIPPGSGFHGLVGGQFRLPAHLYTLRDSSGPPLTGPTADKLSLKFGQSAKDRDDEPAMGRGGVGPSSQEIEIPLPSQ